MTLSFVDYGINRLLIILGTNIVMARALEPSGYGLFSAGMTVAQTFWVIADMGLGVYATREIAVVGRDDAERRMTVAGELTMLRFLFAVVLYGVVFIAFWLPGTSVNMGGTVALCSLFFLVYSVYPDWYFRGTGNFKALLAANSVSLVLYCSALILLVSRPGDLTIACVIWAMSYAPAAVILHVMLWHTEGGIRIGGLRSLYLAFSKHLRQSVHFFSFGFFNNVYVSAPVYAGAIYLGPADVGYFNAVYRLYLFVSSLLMPISSVYYPMLSNMFGAGMRDMVVYKVDEAIRISAYIAIPVAALTGLYSSELVLLMYGKQYEQGAWMLTALTFPVVLSVARLIFSLPMAADGRQRMLSVLSIFAAAVAIALCIALVARYGLSGAVAAIICCEVIYSGMIVAALRRHLDYGFSRMTHAVSWHTLAGLAGICISHFFLNKTPVAALTVGVVVYLLFHYAVINEIIRRVKGDRDGTS